MKSEFQFGTRSTIIIKPTVIDSTNKWKLGTLEGCNSADEELVISNNLFTKAHKLRTKIVPETKLWGLNSQEVFNFCRQHKFPGTNKYPPDHPIWLGNYAKCKNPVDGWYDDNLLREAIKNLFYETYICILNNLYPEFVIKNKKAFLGKEKELLYAVQLRFTMMKIAPKVSALSPSLMFRVLEESGKDFSAGIYCPMAGFGGIIEGSKRWFTKRGLKPSIEAYDINPYFCKFYGWVERDVRAQVISTNKTVIACPPFDENSERWKGTPDDNYIGFEKWCEIIRQQVLAPDYLFFGLAENERKPGTCGIHSKKYGIELK